MARLRQQFPQNYGSGGNISTEFENLVRYLNSAELGNRTVGELLRVLFDESGAFVGPVEMRRNMDGRLEYRVGTYVSPEEGWVTLISLGEIRGEPSPAVGEIGAPVILGRQDIAATASQTLFTYLHAETDDLLVFVDGILKAKGVGADYTQDAIAGTVTFNAGLTGGETVTIYKVRASLVTNYRRLDSVTVGDQQAFAFEHETDDQIVVYKNGILQREGGSFDYTRQPANNTITFNSPIPAGNTISILLVENSSVRAVTGMMFEERFVDPATGLIRLDKIGVPDAALAQAKVAGLVDALGARAVRYISPTTPVGAQTGALWLDTSIAPNQMKFYDGTQWLRTSPDSSLPTFAATDAGRFVRVNNTGTALQYADVDLSSAIPVTARGAANGVAALDAQGRLPFSQLPLVLASDSLYLAVGTPADQGYTIKRIYRQKVRIDGIAVSTDSGNCSVQIAVEGVGVGPTYVANAAGLEAPISAPIEIDAALASRGIGFIVSGNAAAANLEVTLALAIIST
jgi:hypothetical protein